MWKSVNIFPFNNNKEDKYYFEKFINSNFCILETLSQKTSPKNPILEYPKAQNLQVSNIQYLEGK